MSCWGEWAGGLLSVCGGERDEHLPSVGPAGREAGWTLGEYLGDQPRRGLHLGLGLGLGGEGGLGPQWGESGRPRALG